MSMTLNLRNRRLLRGFAALLLFCAAGLYIGFFQLEWDTVSERTGQAFNQPFIDDFMNDFDDLADLPEDEADRAVDELNDEPFLRALLTYIIPAYMVFFTLIGLNLLRLSLIDPGYRAYDRPRRASKILAAYYLGFTVIALVAIPIAAFVAAFVNLDGVGNAGVGVWVCLLVFIGIGAVMIPHRVRVLRQI